MKDYDNTINVYAQEELPKPQSKEGKYWVAYKNGGTVGIAYFDSFYFLPGSSGIALQVRCDRFSRTTSNTNCLPWQKSIDREYRFEPKRNNYEKFYVSDIEIKERYDVARPDEGAHTEYFSGSLEQAYNSLAPYCKVPEPTPQPPTPGGGGESGQTDKTCSNTGQFGGTGTPLKDIKLFLYANKVTKGTIKLSKPQVEVGTFATDWRPNPSDYVERNSPAYKEVKGLAIQHNQDQNKKYIEVQATDGTVYGIDIWGGDAKKLLEQQKAEIEELKKLVQTLETKINV